MEKEKEKELPKWDDENTIVVSVAALELGPEIIGKSVYDFLKEISE